jgi:Fe-S-cluster containining protein
MKNIAEFPGLAPFHPIWLVPLLERCMNDKIASLLLLPFRAVFFAVGFVAYWMEIGADWVIGVRAKTEYVREGSCNRCGRCCRLLALILPKGVDKSNIAVRVARAWHRLMMNFRFIGVEEGWLVYRCGYYRDGDDKRHGRCSIYPMRHRLCRFFPRQMLYGHPSLHKDCGFRFVKRSAIEKRAMVKGEGRATFEEVLADKAR